VYALKFYTLLQFPVVFLKTKEIPEEKKTNIRNAYAFLETFLEGNDYLAGNHYTIADMCCIATVSSIVVIFIFAFTFFQNTITKQICGNKSILAFPCARFDNILVPSFQHSLLL
jgi:glutathione S-transferase